MIVLNEQAVSSLIHVDVPEIEETAKERILAAIDLGKRVDFVHVQTTTTVVVELEMNWRTRMFEGATVEEVIEKIQQAKESW